MKRTLVGLMCIGVFLMTGAARASSPSEGGGRKDSVDNETTKLRQQGEPSSLRPPLREEVKANADLNENAENVQQNKPASPRHKTKRDESEPPSLAWKILKGTLIDPVIWAAGIPVSMVYITTSETRHGAAHWTEHKKNNGPFAVFAAGLAHTPEAVIDGLSLSPVYSFEHAWYGRTLYTTHPAD